MITDPDVEPFTLAVEQGDRLAELEAQNLRLLGALNNVRAVLNEYDEMVVAYSSDLGSLDTVTLGQVLVTQSIVQTLAATIIEGLSQRA